MLNGMKKRYKIYDLTNGYKGNQSRNSYHCRHQLPLVNIHQCRATGGQESNLGVRECAPPRQDATAKTAIYKHAVTQSYEAIVIKIIGKFTY